MFYGCCFVFLMFFLVQLKEPTGQQAKELRSMHGSLPEPDRESLSQYPARRGPVKMVFQGWRNTVVEGADGCWIYSLKLYFFLKKTSSLSFFVGEWGRGCGCAFELCWSGRYWAATGFRAVSVLGCYGWHHESWLIAPSPSFPTHWLCTYTPAFCWYHIAPDVPETAHAKPSNWFIFMTAHPT